MMLKLIAGPLIGMVIGYFTNWLAVKMLFRPREAKYIAGKRLPFTPGVIPRGKERIAGSMREIINTQLLTEESIRQRLASEDVTEALRQSVTDAMERIRADDRTLKTILTEKAGEERFRQTSQKIEDMLTKKAAEKVRNMHLGKIAAEMLAEKMGAALSGSFLGKMFGDSMMTNLSLAVEKTVDDYIDQNSDEIIRNLIAEEKEHLLNRTVRESAALLDQADISMETQILRFYRDFIVKKSGALLRQLDIGSVAEQAILDMSSQQLESLVLSAMKTELKAVVNLGALIGFLLGLINLVIYAL